jgi:hypothetical protein
MRIFQFIFFVIWAAVVFVTVMAIRNEGIAAAGDTFANDVAALGWRGQFDMELLAYMALMAVWLAWRKSFSVLGLAMVLLCFTVGVTFSLIYVVLLSIHHQGDMKKILMGDNAERIRLDRPEPHSQEKTA